MSVLNEWTCSYKKLSNLHIGVFIMKKLFFVFLFLASSAVVSAEDWVSCTSILAPPPYIDTYVASKYGNYTSTIRKFLHEMKVYLGGK